MKDIDLILLAQEFLTDQKISYVKPGEIGKRENNKVEVIFVVPEALNPSVIIDPPDVRVWVDIITKKISLIPQM